jgi:hypothetical protein
LLEAEGVLERCDLVAGDFLTAVPAGGDAYILMRVLHDWDDEHAVTILSNCRRVMGGRSKLLVVGVLMPPGKEPFNDQFIGLNDLNMLVLLAGRQRTEAEYRALFTAAGFTLTRVIPTPSARQSSVIEGVGASPTDR